jgi:hypothetical protein
MVKWKEAFDEHTRMPKALPLPTALFINHGCDTYDTKQISEGTIRVSENLRANIGEV